MSIITQYKLQNDVEGYNGFGLPVSNTKYTASLAATTDTTLTAPSVASMGAPLNIVNKFLAIITVKSGNTAWFSLNATASVPAGATFAASTSELIVGGEYFARVVKAADILHFITATASTDISVVFYALAAN